MTTTAPTEQAIAAALVTLKAAGWHITEHVGFGYLIDTEPPILVHHTPRLDDPAPDPRPQDYRHTAVSEPWQEVTA